MNLLKPRLFLIGFLPGFTYLVGVLFIYKGYEYHSVISFGKSISLPFGIAIVILSFIIGQVFDSFRDCCVENIFEWFVKKDIKWDFFYQASDEKIERLDNNYFIFYILNINILICLLALSLLIILNSCGLKIHTILTNPISIVIQLFIAIIILFFDAIDLRRDISTHTKNELKNKQK